MRWQVSAVQKNVAEVAKLGDAFKLTNLLLVSMDRLVIRKHFEVFLCLPFVLMIWVPLLAKARIAIS